MLIKNIPYSTHTQRHPRQTPSQYAHTPLKQQISFKTHRFFYCIFVDFCSNTLSRSFCNCSYYFFIGSLSVCRQPLAAHIKNSITRPKQIPSTWICVNSYSNIFPKVQALKSCVNVYILETTSSRQRKTTRGSVKFVNR